MILAAQNAGERLSYRFREEHESSGQFCELGALILLFHKLFMLDHMTMLVIEITHEMRKVA